MPPERRKFFQWMVCIQRIRRASIPHGYAGRGLVSGPGRGLFDLLRQLVNTAPLGRRCSQIWNTKGLPGEKSAHDLSQR
jgi:hypothetical protein